MVDLLHRANVKRGDLVAVGISGGLLPCPSALVVLLAAISLHRIALGLGSIATSRPDPVTGALSSWRVAGVQEGFFFWQRVAIGLVAPAILAVMVDQTVRIRSTQSATGLLYVAVVLVVIGEMISRFLYVAAGIPQ